MSDTQPALDRRKLWTDLQDVARKLEQMDRLWDDLHSKMIAASFDEQRDALAALRGIITCISEDVSDLLAQVQP